MTDPKWLSLILGRRQTGPVTLPADAAPRLPELKGIRAVIFDVYGTLFSSAVGDISLASEENRDAAIRAVLDENHIKIVDSSASLRFDDALHAIIHRHQNERRSEGIDYPEVDIRSVWNDFIKEFSEKGVLKANPSIDIETIVIDYETRVNRIQPMPGLTEILAELDARGLVLGIISNAQFYTPFLFEAFLGKTIEAIGFCPDCNVWSYRQLEGKPSQQLYRLAAERLKQHHDLSPDQCLYIGNDMRNDIWPAKELGFRTALFAGDRLSLRRREDHPACTNLKADAELTELTQIRELISMR